MPKAASSTNEHKQSLSEILKELCETPDEEAVTVGEIAQRLGRRSFGAFLFAFSVVNALPLPPGSTAVLGLPMLIIAPQVALGARSPWLPKAVRNRHLRGTDLDRLFGKALPRIEKAERLSRARLTFLFGPIGDRVIGLFITLLALVIVLPIPFGNMAPSITSAALSLALFQRDGVLALIGYAFTAISVVILVLTAGAVSAAISQLIGFFGG